jgi:hypothetical protein
MAKMRDKLGQSLGNTSAPKAIDPKMDDYETEDHMRTLMRAEDIKADPEKMERVHKLAGRHAKSIKSIQDLKNTFDEKFGKGALKK